MNDDTFLLGKAGTEEDAGSDNRMLPNEPSVGWMTSAESNGDYWILNGRKRYIANGGVAKLYFILTRTDRSVGIKTGSTLFLVRSDTPGFRIGKRYNKIGWRFYQNAELIFENARVHKRDLIGEVNGATQALGGYAQSEFGEWELGAHALGICEAACEMAVNYCKTRIQGGGPLIKHQAVRMKLHEMLMLTDALDAFVMRTAQDVDDAVGVGERRKSLLQNYAADVVQRVTHLNMDLHGGAGVMKDVGAEKLFRDAAIWTHLASDNVQRLKAIQHI
jgi:alkylation response protein AidB-like acyl-CoA dehydrogenase